MSKVDMHVHTNVSDGILSPTGVVERAIKLGLRGVAITDHDTVGGIEEGLYAARKYEDFIFIPGIELSTFYNNLEVHILGYFIDHQNEKLLNMTEYIRNIRLNRVKKMVDKLNKLNIDIDISEVFSISNNSTSIGRPHIARILVEKNYASSIQEAFQRYLEKDKPAYIERFKLAIKEAIQLIKGANGIPVLAHPGLINKNVDITELIAFGVQGIEVYHTKHSYSDCKFYLNMAHSHNLIITGGSDYHGDKADDLLDIGSMSIPYDLVKPILDLKNKIN